MESPTPDYQEFVKELIKKQLFCIEQNDRVAVIFTNEITPGLQSALSELPSKYKEDREFLQGLLLEVFSEVNKALPPEQHRTSSINFTDEEKLSLEQIEGFLHDLVSRLVFEKLPQGWPDLQIISENELSILASKSMIKNYMDKHKVWEYLAREKAVAYKPTELQLEQAVLTANLVLAALENKPKVVTAGALFDPRR